MRKCLVTGGAGFIGSHLAGELVARGDAVRVFDNFSTGRPENLHHLQGRLQVLEGDIRDLSAVARATQGMDVVFHQAALPSVPRSLADPLTSHDVNVTGTLNVLMASREAGVEKVVYASSSSVYGDTPTLPKRETMTPSPRSPYAASKLAGESYCRVFTASYGLETVCLRYFNVFGPRQDPTSPYAAVIPKFIQALFAGVPPVTYGDGEQSRDFTFVLNVTAANLLAAGSPGVVGVFNVGCGEAHALNELLTELGHLIHIVPHPTRESPRVGDVKHSLADIASARAQFGYEPRFGFREGLAQTVAWFQGQMRHTPSTQGAVIGK